jgi:transcriptional regulator with XRE-family HTH domain
MRQEARIDAEAAAVRRPALALFLRARRRGVSAEDVGLTPRTRRRNRGLSREEAAYLSGISADWYGRLEAGLDVVPSPGTLLAIARALRLSAVETDYLFELAGLSAPRFYEATGGRISEAIPSLILSPDRVGLALWDAYLTPLVWNSIADAMFNFSPWPTALERNSIVRMLDPFYVAYFGADYHAVARQVVGMFRRAYTAEATPFAEQVYARAREYPDFQRYWDDFVVADESTPDSGPHVRHHPTVGTFSIVTTDLFMLRRHDKFLRVIAPADEDAAIKFAALKALGTGSEC